MRLRIIAICKRSVEPDGRVIQEQHQDSFYEENWVLVNVNNILEIGSTCAIKREYPHICLRECNAVNIAPVRLFMQYLTGISTKLQPGLDEFRIFALECVVWLVVSHVSNVAISQFSPYDVRV